MDPHLHDAQASTAIRRALSENLGIVESFPRDVSILEEAGILFADDKIREYDLAAAALRQVVA